jgi:hypothetical protein
MLSLCNDNQTLLSPAKPSNRLTSPLSASLHTRAGAFKGATMKKCSIKGCNGKHQAKGFCSPHYHRWKRTRNPNPDKPVGARTGKFNSCWRGGEINLISGRVLIYSPNHPHPNTGGVYVFRSRLVVEKRLGRFLLPSEIVHHKNGIRSDDRDENLEYMTQSRHAKIHNVNGKFSHETICS